MTKLKDLSTVDHHPLSEQLTDILCSKTLNNNRLFFRVHVGYYFSKLASMQRTTINTHDRGQLPINMYAVNLAPSGSGKGYSTNIMEEQVIHEFRERFLEETFPMIADKNLASLALKRATRKDVDEEEERTRVDKEFNSLGELAFSFDSGTTAAVKQMRQKLLMANAGSMNMEIDEIGSNLLGQVDVLTTLLELFDVGKVKQKLTKNTAENTRSEEIDGRTPTNLMMFGTQAKLLCGGKVEEEWYSFLETGYARRCIFGYIGANDKKPDLTAKEVYDMATSAQTNSDLIQIADELGQLGDSIYYGRALTMTEAVSLIVIQYKLECEARAAKLGEYNEIRKAELAHRYFKTLKLAGAYAFVDGDSEITEDHVYAAMKLVEESGEAFDKMLTRDRNYVKLAKYFAAVKREVTHVDLVEDLPFYKGTESAKREILNYAISWGYANNIIIKRRHVDGIEFMRGESLAETDTDNLTLAYSADWVTDYDNITMAFEDLYELFSEPDLHWTTHHLVDGYRKEDNAIPGCDMVAIDVDDGVSIAEVQELMKDFKYLIYTTKRHQVKDDDGKCCDRFRLVMPISHQVKLDKTDFNEFIRNICNWLPFEVDTSTFQRARKWMTHDGQHFYNDGKLLDALLFIPKTSKCEQTMQVIQDTQSLSNLERWFTNHTCSGNRSNNLIRYAFMLVDSGFDATTVQQKIESVNAKLPEPMDEIEILKTIMVSVNKRIADRGK